MPVSEIVMICLMAFVLLVPTLMVAVLVSGISRRSPLAVVSPEPAPEVPAAVPTGIEPAAAPSAA